MIITHPYQDYERLEAWKVLSQGIDDLQANGDLEERTARVYIIGYLTRLLHEADLLAEARKPAASLPDPSS